MDKSFKSFKSNNSNESKRKVKDYNISFCSNQFIAKNLFGELRLGFRNESKSVLAFRISHLPLSAYALSIFNLQQKHSNIRGKTCKVFDVIETQSNRYTVMEYFPKTFKTEINEMRKKTKYMQSLLEKFLQSYATLYFMHIYHGNLSLSNICITFDGKVKLMDFRFHNLPFSEGAAKDFEDFRNMMCIIMQRESVFPAKLEVFDQKGGDWIKLFSSWHIVTPYQFLYVPKKKPFQNMVVLLNKVESSLIDCSFENDENLYNSIKVGLRLLMFSHLRKAQEKDKRSNIQLKKLKQILHPLNEHDLGYYNSIIWGIANDPQFYHMTSNQRLALIVGMIEVLNHEYFYMQILKQFDERYDDGRTNELLGNNLLVHYEQTIKSNLIDLS